jgi:hypothetical protein
MEGDKRSGRVLRGGNPISNDGNKSVDPPPERRSGRKRAKIDSVPQGENAAAEVIALDGTGDVILEKKRKISTVAQLFRSAAANVEESNKASQDRENQVAAGEESADLGIALREQLDNPDLARANHKPLTTESQGKINSVELARLGQKPLTNELEEKMDTDERVPILQQVERQCPELLSVLAEYRTELEVIGKAASGDTEQVSKGFTNASYLKHLELVFVLRAHKMEVLRALKLALARGPPTDVLAATSHSR